MADPRKVPFVTLATFNTTTITTPASELKKRRREDETEISHGKDGGVVSAATGAGGGGGVFGNVKAAGGDSGESKITVRLNLSLAEPSEQGSSEFNYSELVQSNQPPDPLAKVKKAPHGLPPPQALLPALDPNDPLADQSRERQEVEALAKRFESKYGNAGKKRKDRIQDLIDIGFGYDETDPFIDNSEAYDELVPASLTTKLGGFYINTGTLQFRAASESEGEDGGKAGNHFKKLKDGEERVMKRRKRKQDGSNLEEKKPRKNRVPKQGSVSALSVHRPEKKKRKKLMKDSLNLAAMLRRFTREKEEMRKKNPAARVVRAPPGGAHRAPPGSGANSGATLNSHPPAVGNDLSMADLPGGDPAVMSLLSSANNDVLQDLMGDLDFGLLESPQPASPAPPENGTAPGQKVALVGRGLRGAILVPPPLPGGLPAPLAKRIEDLRTASRQFDQEGRKKFFTLDMNNILLDIELQVQEQPSAVRAAVYSHLEAFVPCNKEALLKRLKKLSLNIQDDRLRAPLLKLKLAVCSVMPEQIARYNMDCMAKAAKQQSGEVEKNGSEEEDEEKPGRRVMGPRKKFVWDDKLRTLLCNLVRVKLGCYELEGQSSLSAEDYLKAFMETEVKPLWPKGWMQARMLFKESRMVHSHLTGNAVKKRIVPTPKSKLKDGGWVQRSAPSMEPSPGARRPPHSPSEPICLSDSLDEDLGAPSLDSISHALALLSSAAKGLIQNDSPPSPPRGPPPPHKKAAAACGPAALYASTSASLARPASSVPSPLSAARTEGLGAAKGGAASQAPRLSPAGAQRGGSKPAPPAPAKPRPPPTASPLLPPQKGFGSPAAKPAAAPAPGPHKGGGNNGKAGEGGLGPSPQPRAHALLHLNPKSPQAPPHPPQGESPRASPCASPSPQQQQHQHQQSNFVTPMQATLTKSPHSSSSAIIKLTPRLPTPPASLSPHPRPLSLPSVHQYSSKSPAYRPPFSGVPGAAGGYGLSAGPKAPSHPSQVGVGSGSLTSTSSSASKHPAAGAAPAGASANHGQRQRAPGGAGQGAKPMASASAAAASVQLAQVSSASSALLGSSGPSLPLGFSMLGGLVPVSLPFQFPSLLNLPPPGASAGSSGPSGSTANSSSAFSLTQNLLKSLQSGSLPPHLQLAFSDVNQSQGGEMKRKPPL